MRQVAPSPALTTSWLGLCPTGLLTRRGLCTSHNKELFICSCSTVSTSWGAGVYVPGEGAAPGQGWKVVAPRPPTEETLVF